MVPRFGAKKKKKDDVFSFALLCSAFAVESLAVETRGVDAVVARLLLDNLDGLGRGDLKTSNNTDWMGVWRGIAASPDSEWGLTKRALALLVLAAQGKDEFFRVDPPADAPSPWVMRPSRRNLFSFLFLFKF